MKRARRISASASCPSLNAVIVPAESGLDHHLLGVVRPAFDERRGREHDRLAHLRFDAPQELIVQEVPGIHLVDRDRPQRRIVEIAQVLFLPVGRPRRIGVGQVVVRARRLLLERPGHPHARKRPAIELRRRRDDHRLAFGPRDDAVAIDERAELLELLAAPPQTARRAQDARPSPCATPAIGSPPSSLPASDPNSSCVAWNSRMRDGEEAVGVHRDAFVERQLPLEESRPRRNEARAFGAALLEVLDVARNRLRGFGRRIGQIAEQVHVVERGKCARQILLDEVERAAERLETDFDEDARRILDVVAGRLHQTRPSDAASTARGGRARGAARA